MNTFSYINVLQSLQSLFTSHPDDEGSGDYYDYSYYDNGRYPIDDEDGDYASGSGSGECKCCLLTE